MGQEQPAQVAAATAEPPATFARPIRPRLKRRNIVARVALGALLLVGIYCSLFSSGRATVRALALLPALVGADTSPPLQLAGELVRHTQETVESRGGTVNLDVYAPTSSAPPIPGARGGILIIPGVGDERGEPQLINLDEALASAGLVVMDMTTPTLLAYDLAPVDGDAVAAAYLALARWPGVTPERVGILGFSAGGALAAIAATDPRIRDSLAFITLFGGYFDATTLLRDFGRRALEVNGALQQWQPQDVPVQVLSHVIADTLPSFEGQILSNAFLSPIMPLADDQLAQLSAPAQAAYHLLEGDQPGQVDANLAALSPQMQQLLMQLSPKTYLAGIRTPIYLLHDREDQYVPFTQSREFDAALTRAGHSHEYAEFGIFQHVEVRSGLGLGALGDDLTLFRLLTQLLLPGS
jgi:acetyl esterase/lipase